MTHDVRCVAPAGDRCGESPTWDPDARVLYWCDINRFLVHRLDPAGAVQSWHFGEPVTALSLTTRSGTLLVALGSRIILWSPHDDARSEPIFTLPGAPDQRLNDGRTGPGGAFWIGSMANNVGPNGEDLELGPAGGALFRIGADAAPTIHKTGIGIPNTICWSPDEQHFYFADTMRNTIWRYRHDRAAQTIADETRHFAKVTRGAPDGSAVDSEGYLWNCRFGGRCLVRFAPDGRIDRVVEMPVQNPTSCAFGGADLQTLFVTSASLSSAPEDRLAGSLFALRAPVPGLGGYRWAVGEG